MRVFSVIIFGWDVEPLKGKINEFKMLYHNNIIIWMTRYMVGH